MSKHTAKRGEGLLYSHENYQELIDDMLKDFKDMMSEKYIPMPYAH